MTCRASAAGAVAMERRLLLALSSADATRAPAGPAWRGKCRGYRRGIAKGSEWGSGSGLRLRMSSGTHLQSWKAFCSPASPASRWASSCASAAGPRAARAQGPLPMQLRKGWKGSGRDAEVGQSERMQCPPNHTKTASSAAALVHAARLTLCTRSTPHGDRDCAPVLARRGDEATRSQASKGAAEPTQRGGWEDICGLPAQQRDSAPNGSGQTVTIRAWERSQGRGGVVSLAATRAKWEQC
jgi:hypothetical protein